MEKDIAYCGFFYSEKNLPRTGERKIIWLRRDNSGAVRGQSMNPGVDFAEVTGRITAEMNLIENYLPSSDPRNRKRVTLVGRRINKNEYMGNWSSNTNGESGRFWLERTELDNTPENATETLLNLGL